MVCDLWCGLIVAVDFAVVLGYECCGFAVC